MDVKLDKQRIDKLLGIKGLFEAISHRYPQHIISSPLPKDIIDLEDENLIFTGFRCSNKLWRIYGKIYDEDFFMLENFIVFFTRNQIGHGLASYEIDAHSFFFYDDEWEYCIDEINKDHKLSLSEDYFSWSDEDALIFKLCV